MANIRAGAAQRRHTEEGREKAGVVALPGIELRLSAEYALRAAIDSHVFSALRDLEALDGGRAVQAVYVVLLRRLPNVLPDRKRIAIDAGVSESSVKRAIKLLEEAQLVTVKRRRGHSSVYHIVDLRSPETANACLHAIRRMSKGPLAKGVGRATSEPTEGGGRVTCEPTSRVTRGGEVGPQVVQKDSSKNQGKQQGAAAFLKREGRELASVLGKWGLTSASYLVTPGHTRAIPELVANPVFATQVIEEAMGQVKWSKDAGVGARVSYLRENVNAAIVRVRAKRKTLQRGNASTRNAVMATPENERAEASIEGESEYPVLDTYVSSLDGRELGEWCERLYASQPGLRLIYPVPELASTGFRLKLLQFLKANHFPEVPLPPRAVTSKVPATVGPAKSGSVALSQSLA